MGANQPMSTGSPVSLVAMTRPSSLVTFWVLYPWMNPFRVGISRESGSVTFRTGPGPALPAALACAAAARSRARSTFAAARRTRQ